MEVPYFELVSKFKKHTVLSQYEDIVPFLPETLWLRKENLRLLLKKYNTVYVKPSRGTGGVGIFRVVKKTGIKEQYEIRYRQNITNFESLDLLYKQLLVLIKKAKKNNKRKLGKYIIQQGIDLLKYENRLFDLRSFVQFNLETSSFEWRGVLARVSHPNRIITNISRSGTALTFEEVFREISNSPELLYEEIQQVSVRIAEIIRKACNEIVQIGLDFGVDHDLNLWLIEVNLKPRYNAFRKVNKQLYHMIDERSKQLENYQLESEEGEISESKDTEQQIKQQE